MSTTIWVKPDNVYKLFLDGKEKTIIHAGRLNYRAVVDAYKKAGYKKVYISYIGKTYTGF